MNNATRWGFVKLFEEFEMGLGFGNVRRCPKVTVTNFTSPLFKEFSSFQALCWTGLAHFGECDQLPNGAVNIFADLLLEVARHASFLINGAGKTIKILTCGTHNDRARWSGSLGKF